MHAKKKLRLESGFIIPALETGGGHYPRVSLTFDGGHVDDGAACLLYLDPNACTLDEFGDVAMNTLMLGPRFEAKLDLLKTDGKKKLYAIQTDKILRPPLRLAVHPNQDGTGGHLYRLLVISPADTPGEKDTILGIVHLDAVLFD